MRPIFERVTKRALRPGRAFRLGRRVVPPPVPVSQPRDIVLVSEIAEGRVRVSLDEALAVVCALGELVISRGDSTGVLPDFGSVGFDPAGRLHVLDNTRVPSSPVRELSRLLEGATKHLDLPAALKTLLRENSAKTPALEYTEEFLTELKNITSFEESANIGSIAARWNDTRSKAQYQPLPEATHNPDLSFGRIYGTLEGNPEAFGSPAPATKAPVPAEKPSQLLDRKLTAELDRIQKRSPNWLWRAWYRRTGRVTQLAAISALTVIVLGTFVWLITRDRTEVTPGGLATVAAAGTPENALASQTAPAAAATPAPAPPAPTAKPAPAAPSKPPVVSNARSAPAEPSKPPVVSSSRPAPVAVTPPSIRTPPPPPPSPAPSRSVTPSNVAATIRAPSAPIPAPPKPDATNGTPGVSPAGRAGPAASPAAVEPTSTTPTRVETRVALPPVDATPAPAAGAGSPASGPPAPSIAAALAEPLNMVYSRGDAGVVPPRPLRNQLPSVEPYDGVDPTAGTLTLLIDERGRVEQVTLNSPGNRFRERMIVSAAKAWMFRPATKDGRPVRYRLILKITDWERQPF